MAELHSSQDTISTFLQESTADHDVENGLEIKQIIFHTEVEDCKNQIRKVSVAERTNVKPSKSILLVGETGAGKSSLINSLINKYFGIKYEDKFRLKIVDMECEKQKENENKKESDSQTEWVTVYQFNHLSDMLFDYNLTVIDTPGLNDTRGIDKDHLLFDRVEMILKDERFEVDEIHSIGIVTQASANRLTATQKYVFEGCMRMFGYNVKQNIHIMATFSDMSDPTVLVALQEAGVQYVELYQFNNSTIYVTNKPQNQNRARLNQLNWIFMDGSTGDYLNSLQNTDGQSLTKTKETLENRRILHENLGKLDKKFLQNLNKAVQNMSDVAKIENVNSSNEKAFNCTKCHVTCHKPCYSSLFSRCKTCNDLSSGRRGCTVCKCPLDAHAKEEFHYNYAYLFADKSKKNMTEVISSLEEMRNVTERLKTVALKPIPWSFEEYIENLIEKEGLKNEKRQMLITLKQKEQSISSVIKSPDQMEELRHRIDTSLSCQMKSGETESRCTVM